MHIENVRYTYRGLFRKTAPREALKGVTLRLEAGVFALLGPNGSGKTTLIRLLAGLLEPESGRITLDGVHTPLSSEYRRRTGFVFSDANPFRGYLTGRENLVFSAALYGIGRVEALRRAAAIAEPFGLGPLLDERVSAYSKGMNRRLRIARALLHEPRCLVLDEPSANLDASSKDALRGALRRLAADGRTVLITTHDFAEALAVSDRLGMLKEGRLAWQRRRSDVPAGALAADELEACAGDA
jgi:ABC-2 type transport system ATP-binding protein